MYMNVLKANVQGQNIQDKGVVIIMSLIVDERVGYVNNLVACFIKE